MTLDTDRQLAVLAEKRRQLEDNGQCSAPDRHEPRLLCGYPMPCPWHSVLVIEVGRES